MADTTQTQLGPELEALWAAVEADSRAEQQARQAAGLPAQSEAHIDAGLTWDLTVHGDGMWSAEDGAYITGQLEAGRGEEWLAEQYCVTEDEIRAAAQEYAEWSTGETRDDAEDGL